MFHFFSVPVCDSYSGGECPLQPRDGGLMGQDTAVRTVLAGNWCDIPSLLQQRGDQVTVLCPAAPTRGHHHPPASSPLHTLDAG